ncbi:MAG: GspE/PulE family protein, partial [Planctomycetota bacterium]
SKRNSSDADEESEASIDPSVVRLVNELLHEALAQSASDVHIEPRAAGIDVRFRVDGQLRVQPIPDELHRFRAAIISRLKIMAKLNIAEKQRPQDGRIKIKIDGKGVDVRASVIPMLHGEGVVLRLLDSSRAPVDLEQLCFPAGLLTRWRKIIQRPHGMVLVTGPTGSGKTTTLYGSMAEVKGPNNKVITLEDPVEYHMDGISQIPVHHKVGLTFAAGLTSILRHDPDVILIGEIRDTETAVSAVQASLTGHLVFSTLHTNDATSALTRLTDMGIAPYLAASTVQAILAQRLVRRLCPDCKQPAHIDAKTEAQLKSNFTDLDLECIYEARGCKQCFQSGFKGRRAIYELLEVDSQIRELFVKNASAHQIRSAARLSGLRSLRESGLDLVRQGETTIDEVMRIAVDDEPLDVEQIEQAQPATIVR